MEANNVRQYLDVRWLVIYLQKSAYIKPLA